MECIFCKISNGDIPCFSVYENEHVIAFLDISPIAKGHTLVIPKKHYEDLLQTPDDMNGQLISAAKKIGAALKKQLGAEGFNLFQNNGSSAGQEVGHSHLHILPRFSGDGKGVLIEKKEIYTEGEAQKLASILSTHI